MHCLLDHIVLNVNDLDAMLHFYSDILELPTERLGAYLAGKVPFPSLRLGPDTIIDLFPKPMWSHNPAAQSGGNRLNHFCLALSPPDWQALSERLTRHGVAIENGPAKRWGAHGTGFSIYFRDPENNLLEARYYQSDDDGADCLLDS